MAPDATATSVKRPTPLPDPVLKPDNVRKGVREFLSKQADRSKLFDKVEAAQTAAEFLPSPFGDAASAGAAVRAATKGDLFGAGLSAAAMLPIIPAIRVKVDGKWKEFTGAAHPMARIDAEDLLGDLDNFEIEDGFLRGDKWLTRDEAYKAAKQEKALGGSLKTQDRMKQTKQLYSEGLRGSTATAPQAADTDKLIKALDDNGGFTYDPHSDSFVESGGFMVGGVPGQKGVVVDQITPEILAKFQADNAKLLRNDDHFIGGWKGPDGKYYLDVSERVPSRERALELLKERGEQAAFDLDKMEELRLPEIPKVAVGEPATVGNSHTSVSPEHTEQGFGLGGHTPPQEPMEYYFGRNTDPKELSNAYMMSREAFDPRGAYRKFVDAGREYPGAAPWYDTRSIYRDAADEIGEAEAAKRVNSILGGFMPASTARSAPPSNLKRAFLWESLARQGLVDPEILASKKVIPAPGFGHFAQGAHQSALARYLRTGKIDPQANPKPASFGANLTGNHEVGTFDTVMSRIFAQLEPGAVGRFLVNQGGDFSPRKQYYEALERGLADAAHEARGMGLLDDVPPELGPTGSWQSLGWHGATRSAEYGSMDDIWKTLRRESAKLWGVSEKEANRRIWKEGAVPLLPEGVPGLVRFD